jgi:hypothetical protein
MSEKEAKTISIDLGLVNFAYSLFDSNNTLIDFFLIDTHLRFRGAWARCSFISDFLSKYPTLTQMIIERQLPRNITCFAMMYGFVSSFMSLHPEGSVRIVPPIEKFKYLCVKCETKNKNHKKLMVTMVQEYLTHEQKNKFMQLQKKDDVADCILQTNYFGKKVNEDEVKEEKAIDEKFSVEERDER